MIYYLCANNKNVGDLFSMYGVRLAVGLKGRERFLEVGDRALDRSLSRIGSSDSVIIGGGGILKDYFVPCWQTLLKHQSVTKFKMYLFGIGVCSFKNRDTLMPDELLHRIASASERVFLRPPIPGPMERYENVHTTCCPSMLYMSQFAEEHDHEKPVLLYASHRRLVGPDKDDQVRTILRTVCSDNDYLYDEVSHSTSVCRDTIARYAGADIVVSTRLHGYIFGHSMRLRTVAITNDHKIDGYAAMLGQPRPIEIGDISYETLNRAIRESTPLRREYLSSLLHEIKNIGQKIATHIKYPGKFLKDQPANDGLDWSERQRVAVEMSRALDFDTVYDLGSGECHLSQAFQSKEYVAYDLANNSSYGNEVNIIDFDKEMPEVKDNSICFCLGLLEYIGDLRRFVGNLSSFRYVIFSCTDRNKRKMVRLFEKKRFRFIEHKPTYKYPPSQNVFLVEPERRKAA